MRLREFGALHQSKCVAEDPRKYVPVEPAQGRGVSIDEIRAAPALRTQPLQRAFIRAPPVQPETQATVAREVDQQHSVGARLVEIPDPERERHYRLRQAIAQAEDVMLSPDRH